MAFGSGAVRFGSTIEPVATTVAEVEAALPWPVMGTIPASDIMADPGTLGRRTWLRPTAIAIGLLLLAGCPLAAAWAVLGM